MARSNKFKQEKYCIAGYIIDAMQMLKPPEKLTVSEWAEKYRLLDERSSAMPGHWKNSVTPYLVGIMDEFTNWSTEKIVFCKPTQVGGTEALNNMLAYSVCQDPAPSMIVEPTVEMAESFSENRLIPMFNKSPATKKLFKQRNSIKTELQFDGMYLNLTGSNSPSSLASKPIRYLYLDEIDKFSGSTTKEADPINLAIERTKTFNNRRIYMCSTPTTEQGHIWRHLKSCDCERHYFVPCPKCGKMIELDFAQLKYPKSENGETSDLDRAELTYYECQECGAHLTDRDKMQMLQGGKWVNVTKKTQFVKSVGFWLNTLYSPFTRFADIMKTYLLSKDDKDSLHNFYNSWLGLTYKEEGQRVKEDLVKERQTELSEFIVPDWCKILVAGVDVQQSSFYYTVIAFGVSITSQVITCGQVLTFSDIENVMNREYIKQDGTKVMVQLCLVDSGDQTDTVYNFCMRNSQWALPCKGSSNSMMSHYRISQVNKVGSSAVGMSLILIDGGKYKDQIASRLKRNNGTGAFMVFNGISDDFCAQLCSEEKVVETSKNGTVKSYWKPRVSHAQNHFLDCCVYASCAADLLGVRGLFLQEQEENQQKLQATMQQLNDIQMLDSPMQQTQQSTNIDNDWLNSGGNWL